MSDLHKALKACRREFSKVMRAIKIEDPEQTSFGALNAAWQTYYFGPFASFDKLLMQDAARQIPGLDQYVPVSISHHNLHRLFEVLHREIGDQLLGTTRIPERMEDLLEVCQRLCELLEAKAQDGRRFRPARTPIVEAKPRIDGDGRVVPHHTDA